MSLLSTHKYQKHASGPPNLAEKTTKEEIPILVEI
jgi:hypothetical protein